MEPGFPKSGVYDTFNIFDTGADGLFINGVRPPGVSALGIADADDFYVVGTGTMVVPTAKSNVIFRVNSDDGQRLLIDLNRDGDLLDVEDIVIMDDVLSGPHNVDSSPINLEAGNYMIEYGFFERAGGAEGEVSVRLATAFRLLGHDAAVAVGQSLDVIGGVPPAVNGDFNNNGVVDAADYVLWRDGRPLQNEGGGHRHVGRLPNLEGEFWQDSRAGRRNRRGRTGGQHPPIRRHRDFNRVCQPAADGLTRVFVATAPAPIASQAR
jgi:hypothetical protein